MGLELARLRKASVLILGGFTSRDGEWAPAQNPMIRAWVTSWGLTNLSLVDIGTCANTYEEALRLRALAGQRGWKRILLVTSGYHLRRAEATFRSLGVAVVCVPCDLQGLRMLDDREPHYHLPRIGEFELMGIYLKERIGYWLYGWRGWLDPNALVPGEPKEVRAEA
jgi:uncharacterized SAM-binding protein YcdF (DUF218 family)